MPNYVQGEGNPNARIMLVGAAPSADDDKNGKPFTGPGGAFLNELLLDAGLSRNDLWVTNIYKYRPPLGDLKNIDKVCDAEEQIKHLEEEIRTINPNVIVPFGSDALKILTGYDKISKYRGSIIAHKGRKFVPTYKPSDILHRTGESQGYWQKYLVIFDLMRAKKQAETSRHNPPNRNLFIARTFGEIYNYINGAKELSCDIEVIKSIPICIGLSKHPSSAISIPLLGNFFGKISDFTPHQLAQIWTLIQKEVFNKAGIIGQNFKFDQMRLEDIGFTNINCIFDTMLAAHTLNPEFPKSLEFLCSIHTEEPYYKDEYRDYNPHKDSIDRVLLYNAKDAAVTFEVYQELKKELEEENLLEFYYKLPQRLHNRYIAVEREGLPVDNEERKKLRIKYDALIAETQKRINDTLGFELNVNSPKQVANVLYNFLELPFREGTGEDTLVALLNNNTRNDKQRTIISDIIDLRKLRKTKSVYIEFQEDFDGKARTSYRIVGTETGRSSTSMVEPPVRESKMGLAFQTITKGSDIGNDIRRMFVPEPGYTFIEVDLSQAEARVVAVLADDWDTLRMFDTIDIHKETASWLFEVPYTSVTKDMRVVGKTCRHAGNYDMGKRRLMQEIETNARKYKIQIRVSEWKAGKLLDNFHAKTPKLRNIFHKEVASIVESTRTLVSPLGRRRQFFGDFSQDLWREAYAFIPQSTVGDIVKLAMCELDDVRICMEAHDGLLAKVRHDELKQVYERMTQLMSAPIDFSGCSIPRNFKLTIPAEAKVGDNLKDMYDYHG